MRVPVLLTDGGHSDVAVGRRLAAMLVNARRFTFPDAGHVPHRTHPDDYARVVMASSTTSPRRPSKGDRPVARG